MVRRAVERASRIRPHRSTRGPACHIGAPLPTSINVGRDRGWPLVQGVHRFKCPMYVAGRDHPSARGSSTVLSIASARKLEACTARRSCRKSSIATLAWGRRNLAAQAYDLFVQVCPVVLPVTLADTDRAKRSLWPSPVCRRGMPSTPPSCSTTTSRRSPRSMRFRRNSEGQATTFVILISRRPQSQVVSHAAPPCD